MNAKNSFILVHGAWHGGWCWEKTTPLPAANGHAVHAPALSELGERAQLAGPHIGLDTHISDLTSLLRSEDLHDVILVGHSYAGLATLQDFGATSPELIAWLSPKITDQPYKTLTDKLLFKPKTWTFVRKHGFYIATSSRPHFQAAYRKAVENGLKTSRISESEHECMVTLPQKLSETLLRIADE